jgi:hypothetical protein
MDVISLASSTRSMLLGDATANMEIDLRRCRAADPGTRHS